MLCSSRPGWRPVFSCYTDPVLKNVTITLDPGLARWARHQAAEDDISVSKFIARLLEREMRQTAAYWKAYEEWKKLPRDLGASEPIDASKRLTREEAHERR
jgi:hypothetical protein